MNAKIKTRDLILSSARDIFLQQGLLSTVMDDIAKHAGLSRRTLYRYFATKEEIAFEISTSFLKDWNEKQRSIYKELEGSGIQKLEAFLKALVEVMSEQGDVMRYIGEFDFNFADEQQIDLPEEVAARFEQESRVSDQLILSILKEGEVDGTISLLDTAERIEVTISNFLWTFGQRIAIREQSIEREFGMKPTEILNLQIALYIQALKS